MRKIRQRAKRRFYQNSPGPLLLAATLRARIRGLGSLEFDMRTTIPESERREQPIPSRQGNAENKASAPKQVPNGPWGSEVGTRKHSLRPQGLRNGRDPTHCFVRRRVRNSLNYEQYLLNARCPWGRELRDEGHVPPKRPGPLLQGAPRRLGGRAPA